MKVLLIQSYLGGKEPPVYPIGLASLKTALPDHDVTVLDLNMVPEPFDELSRVIREINPEVVGISLRNIDSTHQRTVTFYYAHLKTTLDVIKPLTNAKIVIGGSGFSMFAEEIMAEEPRLEYGVHLEGELTFPDLLNNLETPDQVKSIYYREGETVHYTGKVERQVDMNEIVLAANSPVPFAPYQVNPEAIGVESKRGCVLDCIYCIYGFLNGKKLRMRDPAKVVDEIESLVNDHGVERFTFVDSIFNVPIRHAEAICEEIIKRGVKVKWSAWFNEKQVTRKLLDLCQQAGCDNVILSPDGFSDETLEKLGKNLSNQDILDAYDLFCETKGMTFSYNFFKNPPGQTLSGAFAMLRFLIKAKRTFGRRMSFNLNSMRVEPHTALYDRAVEEGIVQPGENLLHPKTYIYKPTAYIEHFFNLLLMAKDGVRALIR
ncbi:MAG: cobalamin-dependent protein [Magnetococcales bacterium]|nr:cobalamin-dependent protein [Magnetococcales bacterium]